jgi:hypothetical protein
VPILVDSHIEAGVVELLLDHRAVRLLFLRRPARLHDLDLLARLPAGVLQERFRLGRVEGILVELRLAHPGRPDDRRVDQRCLAAHDRVDDALAIDRVHHRLANALVFEIGTIVVDRDLADRGANHAVDGEVRVLLEATDLADRHRAHEVHLTSLKLGQRGGRIEDLQKDPVEGDLAAEVGVVALQLDVLTGDVLDEAVGAGADVRRLSRERVRAELVRRDVLEDVFGKDAQAREVAKSR